MPTQITVNPDQIAISDGSSFLVTARDGSIDDQQIITDYLPDLMMKQSRVGDAIVSLHFY